MMDELQHECGLAAIYCFDETIPTHVGDGRPAREFHRLIPRMLLDLQNRGQLSAGMASYDANRDQILEIHKDVGTVSESFRLSHAKKAESVMRRVYGNAAIGHVRYATCGPITKSYAQPYERPHGCKWKWFTFGFNGNLSNFLELRDELLTLNDYHLRRNNDTEVIMHFIAHAMRGDVRPDLVKVFSHLSSKFDGAYNLVFLDAMGEMIVLRDRLGMRPLCYAIDGGVVAAASESVALQNLGFQDIRSIPAGHLLHVKPGSCELIRYAETPSTAHCFFEWIYFANVASTLDERSVYLTRTALGKELARQEREANLFDYQDGNTIVVPVPDTGKAAADGMAYDLGIPSVEGLIRNRYVGRTFIEANNRADKVRMKFTPLREVLQGKRVILVEDSLVRGTTLANLLDYVKEKGGASEVHVRIACPPIVAPCFYGIDMDTVDQLQAPKFMSGPIPTLEEQQRLADELGANSLLYLPLDAIARSLNLDESQLCRACLTGEYPTESGQRRYQQQLDVIQHESTRQERELTRFVTKVR